MTLGLLWIKRSEFKDWSSACGAGLAMVAFCGFLFVAATWADIEFLIPLSFIGMLIGGFWFLGGPDAMKSAGGALGLLVFMIPWPTTITERLAFPLQLSSSSYAALFSGILGLPIHRDGVSLYVWPDLDKDPVYGIMVAQKCSGMTSLMVLLALGYMIAYFTPVKIGWKALLLGTVVPLTLLANSVRLTLILMAGAHHSAKFAQWVHDNEGPVLIFFCSLGLMGLRHLILSWSRPQKPKELAADG